MGLQDHDDLRPTRRLELFLNGRRHAGTFRRNIAHLNHRGGIIVPPRDPQALAIAIGRLADDAPLRARMGAFNRARFEQRFVMDRVTERWVELFESLERRTG